MFYNALYFMGLSILGLAWLFAVVVFVWGLSVLIERFVRFKRGL